MDVMKLNDYNALHYVLKAKEGHVKAIYLLFYELKKQVASNNVGDETRKVLIDILERIANSSTLARQTISIKNDDHCAFFLLLVDNIKSHSEGPLTNYLLLNVLDKLQNNLTLAKNAIGLKHGRPPDPLKRKADERLAILVLYYYEKTGVLSSNREASGAFVLAAAHANEVEEPTDKQITAARHAWETQEKPARSAWRQICESYAARGEVPVPADKYTLTSWIDGYIT